jgi:predicted acyltransferase
VSTLNPAANPTTVSAPAQSSEPIKQTEGSQRLTSVDALRGFDMFWIVGAEYLVHALHKMRDTWPTRGLANQLEHVDWEGFHFYDLIFPLFVFIVGVSLVFSLTKTIANEGKAAAHARIFRRSILLFIIGILYSGGFSTEWPDIRLLGVLNRIALAYFFAALIFCHFKFRWMVAICASLLLGYWALMAFVPFPDVRPTPGGTQAIAKETGFTNTAQLNLESKTMIRGTYIKGVNLANYLDQKYLPGKKWDGTWDPEGLLSTLPAIATCLLGVFAGLLLQNTSIDPQRKLVYLTAGGVGAVVIGFLWGGSFPVIKKIWTSSYVLVAGGYSALLLAAFYQVIEIWNWRKWAMPFVWIGTNAITLYLAKNIIDVRRLAGRFGGGDVKNFFDNTFASGFGELVVALIALGLILALAHFLYRKKIFLRL